MRIPSPLSSGEETLAFHLRGLNLPPSIREYRFDSERRWRFDFAWPDHCLAVEVEGITAQTGRHQRMKGYESDCEKYNAAALQGWTVLRFTTQQVQNGTAISLIEDALRRPRQIEIRGR